ncbi:Chromatin assembly factor 1 subunit [Cryptotrichosporon argae]
MRPKVLEISWHETQAIYSADFQPLPAAQLRRLLPAPDDDDKKDDRQDGKDRDKDKDRERERERQQVVAGGRHYRLATCGGDSKVRLWMVHPNIPAPSTSAHTAATGQDVAPHPPRVEYLATLSKHTAAVNVVRFSPNGQTLASAGDDGNVILWVPSDKPVTTFGESAADDLPDKEYWRLQRMLQVTTRHVYDLAWSPDGEFFIAGSTDNAATIWRASTGECVFALRDHQHNVQGVAWDPLNEYIASQSSDRSVHVNTFAFRNGASDVHPISRATRMEIRHSRTPSIPSSARPTMIRRGSTASDTGSVITNASEMTEHAPHHVASGSSSAPSAPPPPAAHTPIHPAPAPPMTPTPSSVPTTPQPHAMNPPPPTSGRPGSRRSSFSSQHAASPSLASARGRSPSPMPPLPAIRAPVPTNPALLQRLYAEETATRFFRRLTFSPDGSLLLTPAGQFEDQLFKASPMLSVRSLSHDGADGSGTGAGPSSVPRPKANADAGRPTVYIYSRANLARGPIAHLPGHKTPSVAIRFSPIFYDLRTGPPAAQAETRHITLDREDPSPVSISLSMPPPPPPNKEEKDRALGAVFALPYRLLYAVACQDAVLLYDTQQASPIAIFRGLHYAGFTDIAWSPDGQTLLLSSADGYCSIVVFDLGELGTVHPTQQHHRQLAAIAQHHGGGGAAHPTPSSASATPVPHSPLISTTRQSPAPPRSERESSTSSSIAPPPHFAHPHPHPIPPLRPPSSTASAVSDTVVATPDASADEDAAPATDAAHGIGMQPADGAKRTAEAGADAPKKKRRVALQHLGGPEA